jgi:hypothetical protein
VVGEQLEASVGAECCQSAGFGGVVGAVEAAQAECGVAEAGHDLRRGARTHGGSVLVEGDVAHPVYGVLDAPMTAEPRGDHGGGQSSPLPDRTA